MLNDITLSGPAAGRSGAWARSAGQPSTQRKTGARVRNVRREGMGTFQSDCIEGPLGPRQHRVRLVVVVKPLAQRIPAQRTAKLHRHVVQQTGRAGTVADLDRRNGLPARADRLEPVAVVVGAL